MYITLSIVLLISVAVIVFLKQPAFGKAPSGRRLERIQNSPNYRDGKFRNLSSTEKITSEKSKISAAFDFLFRKVAGLRPSKNLPTAQTDLRQLATNQDIMVWLGHSSLFVQTDGKRLLVDPALVTASPVSFVNKPFKGTDCYSPDDLPDIDYLIITHDHYDHLDHKTVIQLKDRIKKVICPLGVGEHFAYWGFDESSITELDWHEDITFDSTFTIHCLPARHFSGRGLSPDNTLWASFMLQTPSRTIYFSADGGYDTHFADIATRFPNIDLAVLENGQYDDDWKYIHLMPDHLTAAISDLNPKRVFTVHNSKYALGKHSWYAPLDAVSAASERDSFKLMTPMIGEPLFLNDTTQVFKKWWSAVE